MVMVMMMVMMVVVMMTMGVRMLMSEFMLVRSPTFVKQPAANQNDRDTGQDP